MFKIIDFLELLRVKQWYKNILVFIPIIFSLKLFNLNLFVLSFGGFVSLCLISSSYYILNDILDKEKDIHHPEKKKRPIASGKIKISFAVLISIALFSLSVLLAGYLSIYFLYSVLLLFILSNFYTFIIRSIAFLDIILISSNFALRAISGTFIINSPVSYWVILIAFFMSMFLVSLKRFSEIKLKNYKKYRSNYEKNDKDILLIMAVLALSCIFIFFSIYSIVYHKEMLLFSLPFSLYICFDFLRKINSFPQLVRNPEIFIFQKKILLMLFLWGVSIFIGLYLFP